MIVRSGATTANTALTVDTNAVAGGSGGFGAHRQPGPTHRRCGAEARVGRIDRDEGHRRHAHLGAVATRTRMARLACEAVVVTLAGGTPANLVTMPG